MMDALKDKSPTPFRVAPGIRFVRVDAATGKPALSSDKNSILEAFKPGTVPTGGEETVIDTGFDGAWPDLWRQCGATLRPVPAWKRPK